MSVTPAEALDAWSSNCQTSGLRDALAGTGNSWAARNNTEIRWPPFWHLYAVLPFGVLARQRIVSLTATHIWTAGVTARCGQMRVVGLANVARRFDPDTTLRRHQSAGEHIPDWQKDLGDGDAERKSTK